MRDTIRLGRIAGVRVGMHWSLILIVLLLGTGLARHQFSVDAPGHTSGAYAFAGVLTAVGLLVGVLLHEIGHAVVARWRGLRVDGITLSWMGGITRIEGETGSPTNELLVAGIGPLTSAAVGGLLYVIRLGVPHSGGNNLVLAALGWLAWMNVVLALFNILPAAPLDGGKVLHAIVWAAGRDRWRATRVSAATGVILGAAILFIGLIVTERDRTLENGLLIGFVGWWLLASARRELGTGALQRALSGVRLGDVMRPVGEAPGWMTIRAFVDQHSGPRPGWVWLLRDWNGDYSGVLAGDAVAHVPYPDWDMTRPNDIAIPISQTTGASPTDTALSAMLRTSGERVIFVVADGKTVGAVLPMDMEALIRSGGRMVPGNRPAPGPAA
jgi:Zn-dependent protease